MARKAVAISAATEVMNRVNLQMKSDVVMLASDKRFVVERVPTGILTIDRLLNGGFARGRHSELFGDWMTGKSLVMYSTLALAQQRGEVAALVDAERVFNAGWFKRLGGNPKELIIAKPKNANTLGNVLRLMIQRGDFKGVDIIGIDSVAGLLPKEEEEHDLEAGDARVGSLARLMSLMLRQVTMSNEDTTFLWLNQWRDKISRIPGLQSTPGGRALGFYASTRLELREGEKEIEEVESIFKGSFVKRRRAMGRWVTVTVRKEKTGARPETAKSFLLDYASKMPLVSQELIDLGMDDGLIRKQGDYYIVEGDQSVKCYGIKRMRTKIEDDADLRAWLSACVIEQTAELEAAVHG